LPSSIGSSQARRSIERWRERPRWTRAPKLRYLDDLDPYDLHDLRAELESRRSVYVPVVIGAVLLALVVAWLLLASSEQSVIDTAVGVARK
jgi:hypothetical protein